MEYGVNNLHNNISSLCNLKTDKQTLQANAFNCLTKNNK